MVMQRWILMMSQFFWGCLQRCESYGVVGAQATHCPERMLASCHHRQSSTANLVAHHLHACAHVPCNDSWIGIPRHVYCLCTRVGLPRMVDGLFNGLNLAALHARDLLEHYCRL
jgi:hypothetical protein